MIIAYDIETKIISVDSVFNKDLNGFMSFKKTIPDVVDTLPDDGWEFEQMVRRDDVPGWVGYSIACVSEQKAKNLSFSGDITNGGIIYITNNYTAIVYTKAAGFTIVVQRGHEYETNSILGCLPTNHCGTAPSLLTGVPCKSFAVIGSVLYMQFDSNRLVNYPDFKKAIIQNGRLIGAFGVSTGTWNMDIAPTNVEGFRKSILNRWRSLPSTISYPDNEGVFVDGGRVDAFVRAVQTGLSMNDFEDVACRYLAPVSSVQSTKGVIYFGVRPEANVINAHWESIADFGVSCNGKLDAMIRELSKCKTEDDLKKAATEADVLLVDSGTLKGILEEYEFKYDEYKREQLKIAYDAMCEGYNNVNDVIRNFRSQKLDVGLISGDTRFDGVLLECLNRLYISRPQFTEFGDFIDEGSKLISATRGWVDITYSENDDTVVMEFPVDADGLAKALNNQAVSISESFKKKILKMEDLLRQPEVNDVSKCSSFQRNDYFTEHRCHSCKSHMFDTMGFIGNYPPEKTAVGDFIMSNGWWLNDDKLLTRGSRGDAMRRNTKVNRVSVHKVGNSYTVDCEVQVYYFGAISRGMDAVCSTSTLCREIVSSLSKQVAAQFSKTDEGAGAGAASVCVTYYGEAPILTSGESVDDPNTLHIPFTIPLVDCEFPDSCKDRGRIGGRGCWIDTRSVSESYYQGYLQAIKPLRYIVSFAISAKDLFVDMPANPEGTPLNIHTGENGTLQTICNKMVSKVNGRAVKWLIEAIRDAGLLSDVKMVGKTMTEYVSQESLAHLTDFRLDDCKELIRVIEDCLNQNMINETTTDVSVYKDYGAERKQLQELINDIKMTAELAKEKVWAYKTGIPTRIETDWNLIGWYLKM